MYQQGDIVAVKFPFTDAINSKLRPALIISNNLLENNNDVIMMMISSQLKEDGFSIEINESHVEMALPKKSFLRYHRVATIEISIIEKKITSATTGLVKVAIDKLNELLDDSVRPKENTTVNP